MYLSPHLDLLRLLLGPSYAWALPSLARLLLVPFHPQPLARMGRPISARIRSLCARIRSLAPGGQGDRTNRLRPGLVLVRLGANLDCTRLPTYSAVIGAVRGFSARPASLTFATAV